VSGWPDRRILELFGIEHPIIQAPMAGNTTPQLVIAVAQAGGLGSLASAQYTPAQTREAILMVRAATAKPLNVNFFCHATPAPDATRAEMWRAALEPYYREFGLDPHDVPSGAGRTPFDAELCAIVEETRPEIVSFHFGLPPQPLLDRVRATGARIVSSATTVEEARWLEAHGCDAIIAMGWEAGGHRATFLDGMVAGQVGTFALVPQIVDAVRVPVIAAGGIAEARGIVAAFALGASAVQIGTAYLFTPEAIVSPVHRAALERVTDEGTVVTNVFTGRPARGVVNRLVRERGPISPDAPEFPFASAALVPLRARAEEQASGDFTNLWSGQAARLARSLPAGELTRALAAQALARLTGKPEQ
jgi:nitronate monooxygenase